jgi:ribosome maturation factor RimP
MAAVSRERVRAVVLPAVTQAGFDLEDVTVGVAGRRSLVRVVVDRDGGVDLDAVADISRVVSDALDDNDVIGDAAYTLEVTSPGVDRPLTEPRHWQRATGRLVAASGVIGRVLDADDDKVTLMVDDSPRVIDYSALGTGKIQLEFSRSATADRDGDS